MIHFEFFGGPWTGGLPGESAARANANAAAGSKEYVVRDGDVIHFKFNV